ncbi:creatininase family protein [Longimicrobium sp.]|uniref:creatininase family protein n=1 Tax=Longimicrobium sp. TaxID=2029185 RepID=UPI003B3B4D62
MPGSITRYVLAFSVASAFAASPAAAQVLRFAEMDAASIGRLDRARTVVIIPGGILEEHGPLLAVDADGFRNERIAQDVAAAVAARPGWTAVILPTVPIGSGGFERMAGRAGFAGSVPVRSSTLQAVFTDMADALGAQGFRNVFVVHGHGDPNHNYALDQAADYFNDTYDGLMVHLLGRVGCQAESVGTPPEALFGAAAAAADAGSPHAGALETARTWYLRPDLVDSVALRRAPDVTAAGPGEWMAAGQAADWPGYVGAPRYATLQLGRWIYEREAANCTQMALRLLDGADESTIPRYADELRAIPPVREVLDAQLREDDAQGERQARWRAQAPPRP